MDLYEFLEKKQKEEEERLMGKPEEKKKEAPIPQVDLNPLKKCSSCKKEKELSEFRKGSGKFKRKNYCKPCDDKKARAAYKANKQKRKNQIKAWNDANKDKLKGYVEKWRNKNKPDPEDGPTPEIEL